MARPTLIRAVALAALLACVPIVALAQGETWRDRLTWDWGQHQTGLAAEELPEAPGVPTMSHDHWDDPAAPVRVAGGASTG